MIITSISRNSFYLFVLFGALGGISKNWVYGATFIDPARSLLITDLSVLNSTEARGEGHLSFSTQWKKIAPAPDAAEAWIRSFEFAQTVNGYTVAPRSSGELRRYWEHGKSGVLDPDRAPFLLTAIVFRPDLRTPAHRWGEARLIYNVVSPEDGEARDFTVILEYPLPSPLPGENSWPERLATLSSIPFGPELARAVSAIFRGLDPSECHVRTNDLFTDWEWELRDYRTGLDGKLELVPTAQTPDFSFNSAPASESLVGWVHENEVDILSGKASVPAAFLGGSAVVPEEGFGWLLRAGLSERTRKAFSQMTCNGCHASETTTRFTHIFPRREGDRPWISQYLADALTAREEDLRRALENRSPAITYRSGTH